MRRIILLLVLISLFSCNSGYTDDFILVNGGSFIMGNEDFEIPEREEIVMAIN